MRHSFWFTESDWYRFYEWIQLCDNFKCFVRVLFFVIEHIVLRSRFYHKNNFQNFQIDCLWFINHQCRNIVPVNGTAASDKQRQPWWLKRYHNYDRILVYLGIKTLIGVKKSVCEQKFLIVLYRTIILLELYSCVIIDFR